VIALSVLAEAATSSHLALLVKTGEGLYLDANFMDAAMVLGYAYRIASLDDIPINVISSWEQCKTDHGRRRA